MRALDKMTKQSRKIKSVLVIVLLLMFSSFSEEITGTESQEYEVQVALFKEKEDNLSMGNNALHTNAKYIRKDGKDRIRIQLLPMQIQNFRGFLGEITVEGKSVTILSTYEEEDTYNHSIDGVDAKLKGKKYPKEIEWEIKPLAEWIPVEVYVPIMAQMGVGQQKARINIKYSDSIKAALSQTPAETEISSPSPTQKDEKVEISVEEKIEPQTKPVPELALSPKQDDKAEQTKKQETDRQESKTQENVDLPTKESTSKAESAEKKEPKQSVKPKEDNPQIMGDVIEVKAFYRHPITGQIEDTGQNEEIGQAMVENVLQKEAVLQTEADKKYLNLGLAMAKYTEDIQFEMLSDDSQTAQKLEAEKKNDKEEIAFYRLLLPETEGIIRVRMFVVPMQREVIFYMGFPASRWQDAASQKNALANIEEEPLGKEEGIAKLGYNHGLLLKESPELEVFRKGEGFSGESNIRTEQRGVLLPVGILVLIMLGLAGTVLIKTKR